MSLPFSHMHSSRLLFPSLLLLYVVLTACAARPGTDNNSTASTSSSSSAGVQSDLPQGSFTANADGEMQGMAYVRGFTTIEKVPEPFCEQNCAQYDYVFFHVMESGNPEFLDLIRTQQGNAYVATDPPRVGIGCVENGVISYENHSDRYGRRHVALSRQLSSAILDATVTSPIVLKLDKEKLSTGGGAPACYSHFTDVLFGTDAASSSVEATSSASQASSQKSSPQAAAKKCVVAGCSGQLCVAEGDDGVSTCEWREEYQCYKTATCTQQPNGECGWTQTAALEACLENAEQNEQMQVL